jgi:translation initiation factor 2 beta subunit (eIF-2beta)/eIF-5
MNNTNRLDTLPMDVLVNHVYPFSYHCQSSILLTDIRNFVETYSIIERLYLFEYNEVTLFNDLISFVTRRSIRMTNDNNNQYDNILRRSYSLRTQSVSHFMKYYMRLINSGSNYTQKNRLIWGLFTPSERDKFMRRYVY